MIKAHPPLREGLAPNFAGFVKSPSAALRFTFVFAAYLVSTLTPQVLRALHTELFALPSQFLLFTSPSSFGDKR
jgi:hypothetical protein